MKWQDIQDLRLGQDDVGGHLVTRQWFLFIRDASSQKFVDGSRGSGRQMSVNVHLWYRGSMSGLCLVHVLPCLIKDGLLTNFPSMPLCCPCDHCQCRSNYGIKEGDTSTNVGKGFGRSTKHSDNKFITGVQCSFDSTFVINKEFDLSFAGLR